MISFDLIPSDVRVPGAYVEINNTGALRGLPGMPVRILVIGQRLAAGTVAEGVPTPVLNEQAAEEYFGRGSILHLMFRALKKANRWTESWAIALDDDGAGVASAGAVLFGGAPTAAGTVNLWIAGQRVRVAVKTTDTPAAVATAVAAAVDAATDLPVSAAVNGTTAEQVDLTARNKGALGDGIDVRVNYYTDEKLPAGLTAAVTAMNGGSGNPDVVTAIAAIGAEWYTDWIVPWTDSSNLAALESELTDRWGPTVQQSAHCYAGARGSHATLTTLGNGRNSPHLSIVGADNSPSAPWAWAASLGGVCAYHAKIDPARPFQRLELVGVLPPAVADRFTLEERNLLLFDGVATFTVDDGGLVRIERVITTYETNAAGVEDPSYLDLNTLKTVAYLRYSLVARILLKFPRYKLADDGTRFGAGQAIVTPTIIRAEIVALFRQWEEAGLAENIDQFKEDLIVERNSGDPNRVDALVPPDIVNQFRVFAGRIDFLL